jgi:GWxTD domain-containing protein
VIEQSSKKINRKTDSRVEVGKLLVHNLPTDTYTLVLNLIDSVANYGVFSTKRFFVYNPSIAHVDTFVLSATSTLGTMFGAMSEEELDDLFAKSKYLALPNEINQYNKLSNEAGKREFMNQFWEVRDDNPNDARNEYFLGYLKRISESNAKFTALGREGWKTDRGRIYLLYGDPNEIERYPNQTDTRPYEIWTYHDLEGGAYFIFADITGFQDYQLVHSTKRGEMRDDNWSRRIVVR